RRRHIVFSMCDTCAVTLSQQRAEIDGRFASFCLNQRLPLYLTVGRVLRISIGMATVVYNTQPFMLVLMGMVLGERVSAVKWGWLLLAFGGVVILLSSELTSAHGEGLTTGVLLALGAAFFYALTAIIARKLHPLPAQHIAFIQVLVGVVMLLPLVHAPEWTASFPWRYLLILGIVHTGIMYQLLYSAIQKLPTPITGSLSFIYPLVAMVVDYLVFHHALTPVQLIGGMLILFAAAGNNLGWGEKKPRRGGVSEQSQAS
ncbi:DMT family transporter, partial [Klebsiella variicola]